MKRNDITALQSKEIAELDQQLTGLQTELVKARLERSAGQLQNPAKVKSLSDDIARVKTVIRQKQLTAAVVTA
ncbi:MAG: large subunit ribosomal protein [Patescibacteria group bacterium]|jgi:large subunit ribosomal protein L29|nr:large subunit ribosomal protein [Patescibacteria group bacterium]